MPIVDALLPEFDHEMSVTRKLLERVPDDRMDWKPHDKSMSLGQLAQHVATLPSWGSMSAAPAAPANFRAGPRIRQNDATTPHR